MVPHNRISGVLRLAVWEAHLPEGKEVTLAYVAIAAITRNRPRMFAHLAACLARIEVPAGVRMVHVFAENAAVTSVDGAVDALGRATGRDCHLMAEPQLGIPFARNAVLQRALDLGCTHLVFVDDDEWVTPDWFGRLWAGFQASGADLVTGPVIPVAPDGAQLSLVQRRILSGLQARYRKLLRERDVLLARNQRDRIGAATNNWLCDLAFVRRTGLRFRESIGLGSGSDTTFWKDLLALGGHSSWVRDAPVYETIPVDRLTMGFQFRRGRNQALASWERRGSRATPGTILRSVPFVAGKVVLGLARIITGLVLPGYGLALGLRSLGEAAGRLDGLRGHRNAAYRATTGD